LIGLHLNNVKNKKSFHRNIVFGKSSYITDIEIFNEPGFNPHIYIQFNTDVDLAIKPGKFLRSLILTIKQNK